MSSFAIQQARLREFTAWTLGVALVTKTVIGMEVLYHVGVNVSLAYVRVGPTCDPPTHVTILRAYSLIIQWIE